MTRLSRRDFLGLMTAGTGATALSRKPERERLAQRVGQRRSTGGARRKRPNILFLFADDQRFDTIHALGNEHIVTPTLDALVRDGTCFTQAYIMGSTVPAVCAPSRAMLLTGRTLYHVPIDLDEYVSFPEALREAGYTTFGTGKWHNGPRAYAKGFSDGGKIFFGGMSNHLKVPVFDFDPDGKYPKEERYTGESFSSVLFSDAAIRFLREYEADAPFMLYVSYTAPHDPRMAPKEYADMYDPRKIPLPDNFMREHPFDNGELKIRDEKLAPWPRTPEIVREHIAAYYAMITHLDEQMGRVLRALEESGHADDTIVVFAGDNGLAVGQHGLLGKQNMYEHSVRVPLIFLGPGIPKGKRSDALCYLLDVFPTLCDIVGLRVPESVEGHSLLPVMRGRRRRVRDSLFFAYKDVQRAVRDERYKLIEYFVAGERKTQLFDLREDLAELHDLSDDPDHARRLAGLRKELAAWQEVLDDPLGRHGDL